MFFHFSYKAGIVFVALCLLILFGETIYENLRPAKRSANGADPVEVRCAADEEGAA